MKKIIAIAVIGLGMSTVAFAEKTPVDGFTSVASAHNVKDTADKLEAVLASKGMTIFTRINHAQGAKSIDQSLRDTEVVLFGNPKVGTPLMQCTQSVAIDLPQKALVWEDKNGAVWLSYNDPSYLAARHHITGCDNVLEKVSGVLAAFAKAATE